MKAKTSSEIDPVCGMTVDPASARASIVQNGKTYYFCNLSCLQKFQANPSQYLISQAPGSPSNNMAAPGVLYTCPMHPEIQQDHPGTCPKCGMGLEPIGGQPPAAKTEYSCPMHPEIVRDHPGACPICGMALEPRTVAVEEGPNPEFVDMSRRFWIGLVLTVPVFVLAMSDLLPVNPLQFLNMQFANWLQLVLTTPVVLWCGWPFFQRAWASVAHQSQHVHLDCAGSGSGLSLQCDCNLDTGNFPRRISDGPWSGSDVFRHGCRRDRPRLARPSFRNPGAEPNQWRHP